MKISALISILFLAGCATIDQNLVRLTIHTEPQGAMLYQNNVAIGMAPKALTFNVSDKQRLAGELRTASITAIWPSGAKDTRNIRISLSNSNVQATILKRPMDVPGISQDMAHALQVQQMAMQIQQQQQISANENKNAMAELLDAFSKSRKRDETPSVTIPQDSFASPSKPNPFLITPSTSTNCTSNISGSQIYTHCN